MTFIFRHFPMPTNTFHVIHARQNYVLIIYGRNAYSLTLLISYYEQSSITLKHKTIPEASKGH